MSVKPMLVIEKGVSVKHCDENKGFRSPVPIGSIQIRTFPGFSLPFSFEVVAMLARLEEQRHLVSVS